MAVFDETEPLDFTPQENFGVPQARAYTP